MLFGLIRERHSVGTLKALAPLSAVAFRRSFRDGDVVASIGAPILIFLGFYLPLHTTLPDYAGYLLPMAVLQGIFFDAIVSANNAGREVGLAVQDRVLSLPIPRSLPALARLAPVIPRSLIAVASGFLAAYVAGFRWHGTFLSFLAFILLPVLLGLGLAMLTDAFGQLLGHAEAGQVLVVPQMLLIMVSTGLVPASDFPTWLRPFAEHQPVSQWIDTMRGWATTSHTDSTFPAVAWLVAVLVCGVIALLAAGVREARR